MGRSRRSFSTNVHLIGDAQGNPVDIVLTRGQSHESKHLGSLLMGREAGSVLGDRDYDRKPCRDLIAAIGTEAVVPPPPLSGRTRQPSRMTPRSARMTPHLHRLSTVFMQRPATPGERRCLYIFTAARRKESGSVMPLRPRFT